MESLRDWRQTLPPEHRPLRAAAKLLGTSASMLSRYENGLRKVPSERVREFERITGISRHVLRPDTFGPPPWESAA